MNLVVLPLLLTVALFAQVQAEHPVPLPADIDAAKCLECHADKKQGKYVHTALSMGCTACHQVETQGEATKVGLIAPAGELCSTCHEQAKAAVLHEPYAQKRCLVCHDPHSSDNPAHTRAPVNELCLACHGEQDVQGDTVVLFGSQKISADAFRQIPRVVLDRSGRIGHPFLEHPVAGWSDPLHKGQQLSCLSCHLPHAATLPRLLPEQWKEIKICDQCHDAAKAQKTKGEERKP